jgi:hypothetical protein
MPKSCTCRTLRSIQEVLGLTWSMTPEDLHDPSLIDMFAKFGCVEDTDSHQCNNQPNTGAIMVLLFWLISCFNTNTILQDAEAETYIIWQHPHSTRGIPLSCWGGMWQDFPIAVYVLAQRHSNLNMRNYERLSLLAVILGRVYVSSRWVADEYLRRCKAGVWKKENTIECSKCFNIECIITDSAFCLHGFMTIHLRRFNQLDAICSYLLELMFWCLVLAFYCTRLGLMGSKH